MAELDDEGRLWLVADEEVVEAPDWSLTSPDKALLLAAAETIERQVSAWWQTPRSRRRALKLVLQIRNRLLYAERYTDG